jgi:hypothetical protein
MDSQVPGYYNDDADDDTSDRSGSEITYHSQPIYQTQPQEEETSTQDKFEDEKNKLIRTLKMFTNRWTEGMNDTGYLVNLSKGNKTFSGKRGADHESLYKRTNEILEKSLKDHIPLMYRFIGTGVAEECEAICKKDEVGKGIKGDWCDCCYICGRVLFDEISQQYMKGKNPYHPVCEHLYPHISGASFIGLNNPPGKEAHGNVNVEYGWVHHGCNQAKTAHREKKDIWGVVNRPRIKFNDDGKITYKNWGIENEQLTKLVKDAYRRTNDDPRYVAGLVRCDESQKDQTSKFEEKILESFEFFNQSSFENFDFLKIFCNVDVHPFLDILSVDSTDPEKNKYKVFFNSLQEYISGLYLLTFYHVYDETEKDYHARIMDNSEFRWCVKTALSKFSIYSTKDPSTEAGPAFGKKRKSSFGMGKQQEQRAFAYLLVSKRKKRSFFLPHNPGAKHPPHAHAHHDHMHSGTLVS